jgi:hypothetical protein
MKAFIKRNASRVLVVTVYVAVTLYPIVLAIIS